jgi:hypothetical protein
MFRYDIHNIKIRAIEKCIFKLHYNVDIAMTFILLAHRVSLINLNLLLLYPELVLLVYQATHLSFGLG